MQRILGGGPPKGEEEGEFAVRGEKSHRRPDVWERREKLQYPVAGRQG